MEEGYVLADLKDIKQAALYPVVNGNRFLFHGYEVFAEWLDESSEYGITGIGSYKYSDDSK